MVSTIVIKRLAFSDGSSLDKPSLIAQWTEDHGHPNSQYEIVLGYTQVDPDIARFTLRISHKHSSGQTIREGAYKTRVLSRKEEAEALLFKMVQRARSQRGFQSLGLSLHLRERYPKWQKTAP
jgi:hypothetical protein